MRVIPYTFFGEIRNLEYPIGFERIIIMSILLFYIVAIIVSAVGIPMFVKGIIRIAKGINKMHRAGLDTKQLAKERIKMIIFFVLSMCLPFGILIGIIPFTVCTVIGFLFAALSILFMCLMINAKSKAQRIICDNNII